jgi:hypothetical protein
VPEPATALPSRLHSSTSTPLTSSPSGFCLKLQKLENWKNRSIEELLGKAQKIYVRRGEEKQKQKAKIILCMNRLIGNGQTNILLNLNWPGLPHVV